MEPDGTTDCPHLHPPVRKANLASLETRTRPRLRRRAPAERARHQPPDRLAARRAGVARQSGITCSWRGDLADAEAHSLAALRLCRQDGDIAAQGALLAQLVEVLTLTGPCAEAHARAQEGLRLAPESGRLNAEGAPAAAAGEPGRARRPAAVLTDAARALDLVEPTGDRPLAGAVHTAYGSACARLGRTAEA